MPKVTHSFKNNKNNGNKTPLPETSSKINKRIRDLKRSLTRKDLNPKAKIESERKLIQLQYLHGEKKIDERERELSKKYHKIIHFEHQKIKRKIKKERKRLENETDENLRKQIDEKLQDLLVLENYILHYPKTLPYVSVFPSTSTDETRKSQTVMDEVKEKIKQAMANGNNFDELRNEYRQLYRQRLIKEGIIEDAKPVLVDDDYSNSNSNTKDSKVEKGEDDNKDEEVDDFFE
ncbi:hypothetical protein BJ944DRAFT_247498 [Cunninghamella echinulata]|nr:hypothetical protein BJ944DRAFT_247498 [Cunninghamella echinulata]